MSDSIVQVGNKTVVSKIVYGTPYRTAVISSSADIDAISGLVTTGTIHGSLFVYDSDAGVWAPSTTLRSQIIDGRTYPSDSDHATILIRRSGTQGDPSTLRTGELAYSYLSDSGSAANGFGAGGDRLFIGVGGDSSVDGVLQAERVDVIGGKYFTDLLNHQHGVLEVSSAIIVDSEGYVNELRTRDLRADSASIDGLYVSDSAIINNLQILGLFTVNDLLVNDATVNGALTVRGAANFDSSVSVNQLDVRGVAELLGNAFVRKSLVIDSDLVVSGTTTLDEANIGTLTVDSALNVAGPMNVSGAAVFDSSVNLNGDVSVGVRTLREFIDSSVFNLLVAGRSITLSYNDSANTLDISANVATVTTPGVASFDSDQFDVDSEGRVTITEITNLSGGTF